MTLWDMALNAYARKEERLRELDERIKEGHKERNDRLIERFKDDLAMSIWGREKDRDNGIKEKIKLESPMSVLEDRPMYDAIFSIVELPNIYFHCELAIEDGQKSTVIHVSASCPLCHKMKTIHERLQWKICEENLEIIGEAITWLKSHRCKRKKNILESLLYFLGRKEMRS